MERVNRVHSSKIGDPSALKYFSSPCALVETHCIETMSCPSLVIWRPNDDSTASVDSNDHPASITVLFGGFDHQYGLVSSLHEIWRTDR
jgi:hypothetical protein